MSLASASRGERPGVEGWARVRVATSQGREWVRCQEAMAAATAAGGAVGGRGEGSSKAGAGMAWRVAIQARRPSGCGFGDCVLGIGCWVSGLGSGEVEFSGLPVDLSRTKARSTRFWAKVCWRWAGWGR